MEEMNATKGSLLSMALISFVLAPWLLLFLAFIFGAMISALEGWDLDAGVPTVQYAFKLLLSPATLVSPRSLAGKVWGILVALGAFVIMHGILGALALARCTRLLKERFPAEPRTLLLVAVFAAPVVLVLWGVFLAVILVLSDGLDFGDAWLGVMDFMTTRGSLRLAPNLSVQSPVAIFLLQINLFLPQALGGVIVGIAVSHPGVSTFMHFLEGKPLEAKSEAPSDGMSREAKLVRAFSQAESESAQRVNNTVHLTNAGGQSTERNLDVREPTSMENLMIERAMRKKSSTADLRAETSRDSITLPSGAQSPVIVEEAATGWAMAFQAPESMALQRASCVKLEDAFVPPPRQSISQTSPQAVAEPPSSEAHPSLVTLQEELSAAEQQMHEVQERLQESEDRGRELQMQLEFAEQNLNEAQAKTLRTEKLVEVERKGRLEAEDQTNAAWRLVSDTKDALKKAQQEVRDLHKSAQSPSHARQQDDDFWAAEKAHKAELEMVKAQVISTESRLRSAEAKLNAAEEQVRNLTSKLMDTEDRAAREETSKDEWRMRCQDIETQLRGVTRPTAREATCCAAGPFGGGFGTGFGGLTARLAAPFAAPAGDADEDKTSPETEGQSPEEEPPTPLSARFSWEGISSMHSSIQESIKGEIKQIARTRGCAVPGAG